LDHNDPQQYNQYRTTISDNLAKLPKQAPNTTAAMLNNPALVKISSQQLDTWVCLLRNTNKSYSEQSLAN
jgi:hypothetical protein